jgi:hypothetical protein
MTTFTGRYLQEPVYRINDAASRDTTGTVPRMSRKSMGGW